MTRLFVYLLMATAIFPLEKSYAAKLPDEYCSEAIADIGFILDSSGSLRRDYKNEKEFLKTLATTFDIKPNGSRLSVITFSYYAEHSIKLNKFSDIVSFNNAVDKIPLMGSTTRIDKALRLSKNEMFTIKNGGRPGVSKLLILLTDGSQTPGVGVEDPLIIGDELRKDGITIIAIGIGAGINQTELTRIAGGDANTYSANTFATLTDKNFIKNIKTNICKLAKESNNLMRNATPYYETKETTAEGRSFGMDVVFAMDLSSSSSKESLEQQKSVVKSVARYLLPSLSNELALVTYSSNGLVKSGLSSPFNSDILDGIDYAGGTQRVDSAVQVASETLFKPRNENEKLRARGKVFVLFVSGRQSSANPPSLSAESAKLLRDGNVRTMIIALDEIGQDFARNVRGAKLLQYSVDKTDKAVKSYLQGFQENSSAATSNANAALVADDEAHSSTQAPIVNAFTYPSSPSSTLKVTESTHAQTTAQPSCEAVVDVAYILDSSGSLRTEYQKEKNFLKTLAAVFGISQNGSRAGVITFSYYAEHSIKLHNFTDLYSFNKAVDNIPLMGSTTRIDRALRLAQKEMFSQRNGGRVGVTKLIILLTDGSQTPGVDVEEPGDIGVELRKEGISIVVIGIGPGVNQTELVHISGGEANAYSAVTFDKLLDSDFLHQIKNGSCEIAKTQPSCQAVVDIGFILDSSGSLRREYHKEKNFLKTLAAVFGITENGSRAGVITFSYHAVHSIKLHNFTDLNSFSKAVDDIPLMGSTTRIDRALRLAQKEMFSSRNGGRLGVAKLLFLLTDGSQTPDADAEEPGEIGEELRKMGVSIICIGIGEGVNETELAHIAGSENSTYSASTFDKLKDSAFLHDIKTSSCQIASAATSNASAALVADDEAHSSTQAPSVNVLSNSTPGHCINVDMHPLDKDINIALNLLQSGMDKDWIVKFLQNTDSLKMIFKYEKNLRYILSEFQPSLQRLFPEFNCKSGAVEKTLSSIFSSDEQTDILSKARKIGGGQFVDMLWATGLANEILNSDEDITIIVPLSIKNIPGSIRSKMNNSCSLIQMLKYHIIKGKNSLSGLTNNNVLKSTYETEPIYFNRFGQLNTFSGSVVSNWDIKARGGVIHVVETFMLPPATDTISLLKGLQLFSIFTEALKDSRLPSELKVAPHTYFVASDSNLNKTSYISNFFSSDKSLNFLKRHITPGLHFFNALSKINITILTAIDGSSLRVVNHGNKITVNGNVISTFDLFSRNGIIHVIEAPL